MYGGRNPKTKAKQPLASTFTSRKALNTPRVFKYLFLFRGQIFAVPKMCVARALIAASTSAPYNYHMCIQRKPLLIYILTLFRLDTGGCCALLLFLLTEKVVFVADYFAFIFI
jgi:hypothetical protein